ncbi:MAG: hypothetical protein ACRDPW_03315 [Mycobacteriales bacterium]
MLRWIHRILVVGLLGAAGVALTPNFALAQSATDVPRTDHVIVVGAAGLRWQDVSPNTTPTLARLAQQGSVGTMSARAVPAVSCPVEGWLTLGAGTLSAAYHPNDIDDREGCGQRQPPTVRTVHTHEPGPASGTAPPTPAGEIADMQRLLTLNHSLRYNAQPGLLADALHCTSAVGPGAALAAADAQGRVDHYLPRLPEDPGPFLSRCPFTAVDLGALPESSAARTVALRELDARLSRIDATKPANTTIITVGVSQTQAQQARLGVAIVTGDGFTGGWLRSPGTRRLPYVQLIDVAPTAAGLLGRELAETPAGRAWRGEADGRPDSFADTRGELIDDDRHAVVQQQSQGPFLFGLGALCAAVVLTLGVLLYLTDRADRSRGGGECRGGERAVGAAHRHRLPLRVLVAAAIGIAGVPVMVSLLNLLPWWRWSYPLLASWLAVGAGAGVVTAIVYLGRKLLPSRRLTWWAVVVVCGLTVVVLTADALTGNQLQLGSLLGYNPLHAGRFTGFNNPGFAVFGATAMLFTAFIAHGHRRWISAAIVTAVAVPVTAVEGLPRWGADVGGILTLLPAFVLLGLLVSRTRVTWQRLGLGALAGAAVFLIAGWLDYLRPEASRTHFGSFFSALLDGTAWSAIRRKLLTNAEVLVMGPHTVVALLLAIALVVAILRPPPLLRQSYDAVPALRPGLVTVAIVAALGFATNDSGVIIPAVLMLIAGPLTFAACAQEVLDRPQETVRPQ